MIRLGLFNSISAPKIRIIPSVWNEKSILSGGGVILAEETNKIMDTIAQEYDWLFYLQADEVVHEKHLTTIIQAMKKYKNNPKVEGLLFQYLHFYGSYDYVGDSRIWYRKEIRIIRNDKQIRSYKDAQGFRKNGRKLRVKEIDACIYHYGWVKPPAQQFKKRMAFDRFYTKNKKETTPKNKNNQENYFHYYNVDSIKPFTSAHPRVMQDLIRKKNWNFNPGLKQKHFPNWKHHLLYYIEKYTGKRLFEYRNYKII